MKDVDRWCKWLLVIAIPLLALYLYFLLYVLPR